MQQEPVVTKVYAVCLCWLSLPIVTSPMFTKRSDEWLKILRYTDTNQMNYGAAVSDVDNDGDFEVIIAGFTGPNLVLKYDRDTKSVINIAKPDTPFEYLMDPLGQALGVCTCDIDGDGREEIYVLNSNQAYAGLSSYGDKLFKWRNGHYVDLLSDPINVNISAKNYAGRSVACMDRHGSGKYGIIIATYALGNIGNFALLEMNEAHQDNNVEEGIIALHNVASEAKLDKSTGGRGLAVGPILSPDGKLDIFFNNEGNPTFSNLGDNFLMRNIGNGTFIDEAYKYQLQDKNGAGRGVVLTDLDRNGLLDIVYGNYEGENKILLQSVNENNERQFTNVAHTNADFEKPCMVRTVLASDFDNDGNLEIFFNNINDFNTPQVNRLFTIKPRENSVDIIKLDPGDALEEDGFGTGGVTVDLDQDGYLDLILTHGEDVEQPIEIYGISEKSYNNFIRILVKTKYGAPARGASVQVLTSSGDQQMAVIDSGSGYLCQMEPVAHFGLGKDTAKSVVVLWPDRKIIKRTIFASEQNSVIIIEHPDRGLIVAAMKTTEQTLNNFHLLNHTEL